MLNISSLNRAKCSRWNYRKIHKTERSSLGLNPSLLRLIILWSCHKFICVKDFAGTRHNFTVRHLAIANSFPLVMGKACAKKDNKKTIGKWYSFTAFRSKFFSYVQEIKRKPSILKWKLQMKKYFKYLSVRYELNKSRFSNKNKIRINEVIERSK